MVKCPLSATLYISVSKLEPKLANWGKRQHTAREDRCHLNGLKCKEPTQPHNNPIVWVQLTSRGKKLL